MAIKSFANAATKAVFEGKTPKGLPMRIGARRAMSIVLETEEILPPLHPGEVLREEFLIPLGLTPGAVARACGVPRTRIERVASEEVGLTTDTALRLGRYFGTTAGFWLNLQKRFELETLERAIGPDLDRITPLARDAA